MINAIPTNCIEKTWHFERPVRFNIKTDNIINILYGPYRLDILYGPCNFMIGPNMK